MKISLTKKFNPLGALLMVVILLVIIGGITLSLLFIDFGSLGSLGTPYKIDEIYALEKFDFEKDYIKFTLKDKGYLIPGYRNNSVYGVVILGDGSFVFKHKDSSVEENFSALFIPMYPEEYQLFRENLILTRVYDSKLIEQGRNIFKNSINSFFHYRLFENLRFCFKPINTFMAAIETEELGYIKYIESNTVKFAPQKGKTMQFNNPDNDINYPPFNTVMFSIILICLYSALLVGMAYIGSVDIPVKTFFGLKGIKAHSREKAIIIGSMVFYIGIRVMELSFNPGNFAYFLKLLGLVFLLVGVCRLYSFDWTRVGIRSANIFRGTTMGVVLGVLGFFLGAMALPKGLHIPVWKDLIPLLCGIICQELYYRGLLQTYIANFVKPLWAAAVTPVVHAAVYFIPLFILQYPIDINYVFQGSVIIPLTGIIPGFLYYKMGSVFPGIAFLTTLLVLSKTIVF